MPYRVKVEPVENVVPPSGKTVMLVIAEVERHKPTNSLTPFSVLARDIVVLLVVELE